MLTFVPPHAPRPVMETKPEDMSWTAHLSMDEIYAIADYTQTGYRTLNSSLRDGKPLSVNDNTMCVLLDNVMAKAPSCSPRVVYRVQQVTDMPEVGETYSFPSFVSTSTDPSLVTNYMGREEERQDVIFEILTSQGVDVNMFSAKEGREKEILLPRDMEFVVEDVFTTDWVTLLSDENAGVSYDYCHKRNVKVIRLRETPAATQQMAA